MEGSLRRHGIYQERDRLRGVNEGDADEDSGMSFQQCHFCEESCCIFLYLNLTVQYGEGELSGE